MFSDLLRRLGLTRSPNRAARRRAQPRRLGVERLEVREVPATVFAIAPGNNLLRFDSTSPGTIQSTTAITGLGAGDSAGHGPFVYDWFIKPVLLRTIYQDKDRQEAIVMASGLDWVIVRPAVLTDKPAAGRVQATVDLQGVRGGQISRADVAAFVVAQTGRDEWLGQTPLIT